APPCKNNDLPHNSTATVKPPLEHGETTQAKRSDSLIPDSLIADKNSLSELQNSSDQVSAPSKKKSAKQPSQAACWLAGLLRSEILRNKSDYRITSAEQRKWEVTAQRMLDIDKRKPEQIEFLIRWVQHDEFWMTNILSMDTLRKKFDQLGLKAAAKTPTSAASTALPATYVPGSV